MPFQVASLRHALAWYLSMKHACMMHREGKGADVTDVSSTALAKISKLDLSGCQVGDHFMLAYTSAMQCQRACCSSLHLCCTSLVVFLSSSCAQVDGLIIRAVFQAFLSQLRIQQPVAELCLAGCSLTDASANCSTFDASTSV